MKSMVKYFPVALLVSSPAMFKFYRLQEHIMLQMPVFEEKKQQIGNVTWPVDDDIIKKANSTHGKVEHQEQLEDKYVVGKTNDTNMTAISQEPLTSSNNPQYNNDQEEEPAAHLKKYDSINDNTKSNTTPTSTNSMTIKSDSITLMNLSLDFEQQTEKKNAEKISDNIAEPLTSSDNSQYYNDREESSRLENYTSSGNKSNSTISISTKSDTTTPMNSSFEFERQIHLVKTTPSNQSTNNSIWVVEMMKNGLTLSAKQQSRFDKRKHLLAQNFPQTMRYLVDTYHYSSIILNDEFAYRHIWKCGGTTMMQQTGKNQSRLDVPEVLNRKWVTFIRDPIDHFLSGWAECLGSQAKQKSEKPYDVRVKDWLTKTVKCIGLKGTPCNARCFMHSMPQANFLLNNKGTVYPQMEVVGDLRELPGLLKMLGIGFNESLTGGRIASQNQFLNKYYPRRQDLLSNKTLQGICKLVAVDYFLFDFDPPDVCANIIQQLKDKHIAAKTIDSNVSAISQEQLTSNNPQFNDKEEAPAHLANYISINDNAKLNNMLTSTNSTSTIKSDTKLTLMNSSFEFERQIHLVKTIPSYQSINYNNSMRVVEMMKNGLSFSAKHQSRFDKRKHLLAKEFPKKMRYLVDTYKYSSIILNDEFAYRHIWRSGGTTMMQQTGKNQSRLDVPEVLNRKWVTFIQDPIDHFLSGWAECLGSQIKRKSEQPYDDRVNGWLTEIVKCLGPEGTPCSKPVCIRHSMPQANFFLNNKGTVYPQMDVVGDLRELPGVIKMLGIGFNESLTGGRIASQNQFLNKYYPQRQDLLSNKTLQGICKLVAIDYFLFDFDPPDVCADIINWQTVD